MGTLEGVKLKDRVLELCDILGLIKFVGLTHYVYKELTLEFYTTLKFSKQGHKKFEYMLNGKLIIMDYNIMLAMFRFSKGGIYEHPIIYKSRYF